jgi:hypothetical protein
MLRKLTVVGITLCSTLFVSLPTASAATRASVTAGSAADNAPQTLGSATFYGTTTPVSLTAAAAKRAASQPDFHTAPTLGFAAHEAAATPRALSAALQPPSPAGTPTVDSIGAATGFNAISHIDQRNAGTGIYASTNNNIEPPDQALCAGNGFVVEAINDALAVYDENGNSLTAVTALNQFYHLLPFFNRVTGFVGDDVSDPKCYYDPVGKRFIQTILEVDSPGNFGQPPFNRTHILIAVSQTSDPTGSWNLFTIDSSDDGLNGTPAHTACPCLPDQPLLGANQDGVFIDTNELQNNASLLFNGVQMYALGRASLESSTSTVGFVHLDLGPVPTGDANLPMWGSIQPSTALDPGSGTELLMSGGPDDIFQSTASLDNRIAVWSLTGTGSLNSATPHVALRHVVLASQTYGVPLNTGATQKAGPTPLRDLLNQQFNDNDPLEAINSNDSRMRSQVTDLHGILYGATNTTVTSATGPPRIGIAYFVVGAIGTPSGVVATIIRQGYLAADGENVLYPSIALNSLGLGSMSFTLSGPDFFPSAAYVRFDLVQPVGPIHVAGEGAAPEDGFSGYNFFQEPVPGVARWGDYSAAVFADGAVWMGNEFIPSTPRSLLADWGTFITRLPL